MTDHAKQLSPVQRLGPGLTPMPTLLRALEESYDWLMKQAHDDARAAFAVLAGMHRRLDLMPSALAIAIDGDSVWVLCPVCFGFHVYDAGTMGAVCRGEAFDIPPERTMRELWNRGMFRLAWAEHMSTHPDDDFAAHLAWERWRRER
jgi:hypothetical protein